MAKEKFPSTNAIRALRAANIEFTNHLYQYEEHGGTKAGSRELNIDEHMIIKTLVMEDEKKQPFLILMHGDKKVSTKDLARTIGVKTAVPCSPNDAHKHTGYLVGGISPFGTRKQMPVYMEKTILSLPQIYINGGKRGYLVGINPHILMSILKPTLVSVAIADA